MENLIGTIMEIILAIIGIPMLIYIFIKVRKMEKESKKRWKELDEIYS